MDAILDPIRDAVEGQIDFKGQALAENLFTYLLSVVGVLSFLAGLYTKNIHNSLYTGLAGTALTFIVVVPAWPFFNKHPVRWLPSRGYTGSINVQVDGKKVE